MDEHRIYHELVNSLTHDALRVFRRPSRYDARPELGYVENEFAGAVLGGSRADEHLGHVMFVIGRRRIENDVIIFDPGGMEPEELHGIVRDFVSDSRGKKIFVIDRKNAMKSYAGPGEFYRLDADWLSNNTGAREKEYSLAMPADMGGDFYRRLARELFSGGIPVVGGEHVYYHFNKARNGMEIRVLEISGHRMPAEVLEKARASGMKAAVVDMRPGPREYPCTDGLNIIDLDVFAARYAKKSKKRAKSSAE